MKKLPENEKRERRLARCKQYRIDNLESLREYDRKRSRNPERLAAHREYVKRTWPERLEYLRKYKRRTWRKYAAKQEVWKRRNHGKVLAASRKYYRKNPGKHIAVSALWCKNNKDIVNARAASRRALKLSATPKWADMGAMYEVYKAAAKMTRDSGIKHEVDHIYPLKSDLVCGLHTPQNLQILTKSENCRKHNNVNWNFPIS